MMDLRGRVVVVFGGSGFIGRYVVRELCRAGARVRVAMRQPHLGGDVRLAGHPGQVQLFQANVRDENSVARAISGSDAVINLVAVLYEKGKQGFEALHVRAAEGIARAASAAGVSALVHISAQGADPDSSSAYARTKGEGEQAVRRAFPQATILRPSVVFGPEDQFLNRFAAMAAGSFALPLIGFGRTRFQPVFVEDLARAIVGALARKSAQGRVFEIGGPKIYSFREVLELILRVTDRRRILVPLPFFGAWILGSLLDAATRILPIAPPLTGDQVEMLRHDNVVPAKPEGVIGDLVEGPLESMEAIAPKYLWRFRHQGQFHKFAA